MAPTAWEEGSWRVESQVQGGGWQCWSVGTGAALAPPLSPSVPLKLPHKTCSCGPVLRICQCPHLQLQVTLNPQRGNSTTALSKVQVDMATLGPLLGYSHKPGLPAVGMGGACQCEVRAGESSKPHSESPLGVFQVRVWYGDLALTNSCPQSVHHPTHPG